MPQDPLSLLCIEPRFPGRLGWVADWLVRKRGYRCQFYCASAADRAFWPASTGRGMEVIQFNVGGVARERTVPWTRHLERGLCYAYGCGEVLHARRPRGIDIVLGRSATLGSTLFTSVFQPGVPIVNFFDYYHRPDTGDLTADLGPSMPPQYFHWRRTTDAMNLLDLENGVHPWTATAWQRGLFPRQYHDDFLVLHPGVDSTRLPGRTGDFRRVSGRSIPPGMRVVSFVARTLDRLRGFDRFVALANRLLADDANVLCIAAGGTPVERGLDVEFFGQDYAAHVLGQTPPPDPDRFWLLGVVRPAVVAELLAASDLHVYPSRPYPVAQSLLEALASGCVVLAWDSEPVREVLTPGQTGLLAPPNEVERPFQHARAVLRDPAAHAPLGRAAAALVREHYAQEVTLPRLAEHLQQLVERGG
jgi:glycosyltransferase involved in cell wall biosynthesis